MAQRSLERAVRFSVTRSSGTRTGSIEFRMRQIYERRILPTSDGRHGDGITVHREGSYLPEQAPIIFDLPSPTVLALPALSLFHVKQMLSISFNLEASSCDLFAQAIAKFTSDTSVYVGHEPFSLSVELVLTTVDVVNSRSLLNNNTSVLRHNQIHEEGVLLFDADDLTPPPPVNAVVHNLVKMKLTKEDVESKELDVCTVCLEEFLPEIDLVRTPCSHLYHWHCIDRWLQRKSSCPTCRQIICCSLIL